MKRRFRPIIALGLASALLVPAMAIAGTYEIDKSHTEVRFSWGHLGMSRQSGRFLDTEGTVEFDPEAPEAGRLDVRIKAASVATGATALDKQLRSPDYFDADRHPLIRFKSTAVRKISDKTGEVTGDLTIMGVTHPVTLAVTWNFAGEHPLGSATAMLKDKHAAGFSATTRIYRSDFGLKRMVPLVSDEIEIAIETEMIRK